MAAPHFHLFPDSHPRARKSQVHVDAADLVRFPDYSSLASPLQFELAPGEALSIPAFWLHEVEALTPSLSLNQFSPSAAWERAEQIFGFATPFSDSGQLSTAASESSVIHLYAFTYVLLPLLSVPTAIGHGAWSELERPHRYVETALMRARYEPLLGAGKTLDGASRHILRSAIQEEAGLNAAVYAHFAADYVAAFTALGSLPGGEAVRDLVLAHLLELWAVRLVGPRQASIVLGVFGQLEPDVEVQ